MSRERFLPVFVVFAVLHLHSLTLRIKDGEESSQEKFEGISPYIRVLKCCAVQWKLVKLIPRCLDKQIKFEENSLAACDSMIHSHKK